jgi:UDP-4-amino-4,6-dideoxy-N-acetyl-beta-L-altrosamine transaminase
LTDFLPYGRQWISEEDITAVTRVLRGDFLTTGPEAGSLEAAFCEITGATEAVACSSGTAALHLVALALDISPGDVAIVPTMTFSATANAIRYCGGEVVFSDVDPETGLIDTDHLANAIQRAKAAFRDHSIRAVLPVHLNGETPDMPTMSAFCESENLEIIEDACHALGGTYNDPDSNAVGSGRYARFATFSLHPVKIVAMGEGGVVSTNDSDAATRMRRLRSHGIELSGENFQNAEDADKPWIYELQELGYNYRASDIHCALASSQLTRLPSFLARRRELAARFDELLKPLSPIVATAPRSGHCQGGWHLYPARIDFDSAGKRREDVMHALRKAGIATQVHYKPVHTQPYYEARYGQEPLPGAQAYYEKCLSLPLFPRMENGDVDRVVSTLARILEIDV